MNSRSNANSAVERHHAELARAAAAAMQKHYQETVEICSDLLTSGVYDDIAEADPESARQYRAEARLTMATAMHYNDAHYDDILRVLNAALESPLHIQKDVYFTLAVLHVSFDHLPEAQAAMEKTLAIIAELRQSGAPDSEPALSAQEKEARQFLKEVAEARTN
ncbi:MAG: hypothetical protein JWO13_1550 [Acidobacteriales bacterium]|nr:hypothetical protein [Terriglobales bacterium]